MNKEYRDVLENENKMISEVLCLQQDLRKAVNSKDWIMLMQTSDSLNEKMDSFNNLDKRREQLSLMVQEHDREESALVASVRKKLLKSRIENKAFSEYISVTREFVRSVVDTAVPQSRNKLYSRKGCIVQPQPERVVVDALF